MNAKQDEVEAMDKESDQEMPLSKYPRWFWFEWKQLIVTEEIIFSPPTKSNFDVWIIIGWSW